MADTEASEESSEETTTEPTTTTATAETGEDAAKWKSLSRKNEKELKAARDELEKLRAASMSEQEKAVAQARAEGRADAMKEANRKLLHAEVRAAAAGVLADPQDAVHLLDMEQFDPDNVDSRSIKAALEDLVKAKPYLSVQPGNGAGEGGPRGTAPALNSDALTDALARAVGAQQ